jgi:enoyl-CoA hydratase/carnithine racemase
LAETVAEPILLSREGAVATLTLNRPELRNPISDPDTIDAIVETLGRIQLDRSIHVAILTGSGSAFSSGGNLKQMGSAAARRAPAETLTWYDSGIQRIPRAFDALEVPIIAAVNGPAIGAGCDLACMCDIRIAAESATFAESFVKVGLVPGDGGAWLLQQVIGYAKACEMTFTGDALSAQDALACGLVSRVVPDATLMQSAQALARRIAANPPQVVRMSKRLMQQARVASLESVLQLSAALQGLAHTTSDHVEAVAALLEKRAPRFTGQ